MLSGIPAIVDQDIELLPFSEKYDVGLWNLIDGSRAYLRRWQNWPDQVQSLKDMRKLISHSQKKIKNNDGLDMVVLYKGRPAGKIGLVYIDWRKRRTEIGYWLGQHYEGLGLITRSCRVLTDYALTGLNLEVVLIRCAVENVRSSAIAERLGFVCDGILSQKAWIHGVSYKEVLYSMSRKQWKARMIYHITTRDAWKDAQVSGEYQAKSLETEGFIHFSKEEQVVEVANRFYVGQQGLILLCVDPAQLRAPLRHESSDDGQLYPHLYGTLPVNAVQRVSDFWPNGDGRFTFPVTRVE